MMTYSITNVCAIFATSGFYCYALYVLIKTIDLLFAAKFQKYWSSFAGKIWSLEVRKFWVLNKKYKTQKFIDYVMTYSATFFFLKLLFLRSHFLWRLPPFRDFDLHLKETFRKYRFNDTVWNELLLEANLLLLLTTCTNVTLLSKKFTL